MDDLDARPQLEKRLLPLLDVALCLLGILLVVVSVSDQNSESGFVGDELKIVIESDGSIVSGSLLLARTGALELDAKVMNRLLLDLKAKKKPKVSVHYNRPKNLDATVSKPVLDGRLIDTCIKRFESEGFPVRVFGSENHQKE